MWCSVDITDIYLRILHCWAIIVYRVPSTILQGRVRVGLGTSWSGYELVWVRVGQKWVTWVRVGLGMSWSGYELDWVRVSLGTSWSGYELDWVRVSLGTSWSGYELDWVRVGLGTSWIGSQLVWVRVDPKPANSHRCIWDQARGDIRNRTTFCQLSIRLHSFNG